MKQIKTLLLILILTNGMSSFSQIYFGGRVGMNMSFLSVQPELIKYNKVSELVPKLNIGIAALGYFELGPYIAIQPEVIYNRKGLKSRVDVKLEGDTLLTGDWNYSFDYIELPLLFKLSLNSDGFDPFIEFGGYYGYMFHAKYEEEAYFNNEQILKNDYSSDFEPNADGESLNQNEYGFKIGIGGTLELSKGVAFFSIRYSQGLTDLINYQTVPTDYEETYNRVFQLTLGYAFEVRRNTKDKVYYY